MAKRFTSSDKWEDPWYRRLTPSEKNFWDYICCRCDNAGVWKPEWDLAEFMIGSKFDSIKILQILNEGKVRVNVLKNGSWQILGWIVYQCGGVLNDKIGAHRSIMAQMSKYSDFGFIREGVSHSLSNRVSHTLIDKKETRNRQEKELNTSYTDNTINRPEKRPYVDFDKMIEEGLGRIATKDGIKSVLLKMPDSLWWKVDSFLKKRYPEGGNGFEVARAEIVREGHFVSENLKNIIKDVGKPIPEGSM